MTITEGGGKRAVFRKFQDLYLPSLKANFMLWPAAQLLNFRVIPFQFQIVSIIYTICADGFLLLMWILAIRVYSWHCLDRISVAHELVRR